MSKVKGSLETLYRALRVYRLAWRPWCLVQLAETTSELLGLDLANFALTIVLRACSVSPAHTTVAFPCRRLPD